LTVLAALSGRRCSGSQTLFATANRHQRLAFSLKDLLPQPVFDLALILFAQQDDGNDKQGFTDHDKRRDNDNLCRGYRGTE